MDDGRVLSTPDCLVDTVVERAHNWPSDITLSELDAGSALTEAYIGLAMAGALYGGMHLLAWNAPFASRSEELLWRISGLLLMTSGPVILLLYVPRNWFRRGIEEWANEPLANSEHLFLRLVVLGFRIWVTGGFYLFTVLLVAFGVLYVFARVYLIVEWFLKLTHLPVSAYQDPSWTQYFPHIG